MTLEGEWKKYTKTEYPILILIYIKKAVLKQKLILILRQPLSFIRMYFIYSHGFQSLDKANTLPIVMPSTSFVVS